MSQATKVHYAIEIVPFGDEFASPQVTMELAAAAESAGWDGLFIWDHMAFVWGIPSGDPWIMLAAAATATTRLRLGTGVAPLPRYHPHVLARMLAALDALSDGRAILGAGLGGQALEFSAFGEPQDEKTRAEMMDEALGILRDLMGGDPVTFNGRHYRVEGVALRPLPVQRPRIPIWIGGDSRPALRRAAQWDGWIIGAVNEQGEMVKSPAELAEQIGYIARHRSSNDPFEVAMSGCSQPHDRAMVTEYQAAGMTWWLETLYGSRGSVAENKARILAGPPA